MKNAQKTGEAEHEDLLVRRIKNGTVIDHIDAGEALNVVKILGIAGTTTEALSIATNVMSGQMGKKDIVKLSNRELSKEEVNRIALISPPGNHQHYPQFQGLPEERSRDPDTD